MHRDDEVSQSGVARSYLVCAGDPVTAASRRRGIDRFETRRRSSLKACLCQDGPSSAGEVVCLVGEHFEVACRAALVAHTGKLARHPGLSGEEFLLRPKLFGPFGSLRARRKRRGRRPESSAGRPRALPAAAPQLTHAERSFACRENRLRDRPAEKSTAGRPAEEVWSARYSGKPGAAVKVI